MTSLRIATVSVLLGMTAASVFASQRNGGADGSAFFCNVKALNHTERAEYDALTVDISRSITKTRELPNGYAFELDSTRLSLRQLAAWTDFERRCCPFFDFQLAVRPSSGPLTLRLTGQHGIKMFIRAEFPQYFR